MIYFFYGNDELALKEYLLKWKNGFIEKFGAINLLDIKDYDDESLFQNLGLGSSSLFQDKRLIILNNLPISSDQKDKMTQKFQDQILEKLDTVEDSILLVFVSISPDKRGKLYKKLVKMSKLTHGSVTLKSFELKDERDALGSIQRKYPNVDNKILQSIFQRKAHNIQKTVSEIDKLCIAHDTITPKLVEDNIAPEFEQSIFECIDNIVRGDKKNVFINMQRVLSQSEPIPFYYGLLSNLRLLIYIGLFKRAGSSQQQIVDSLKLGNRSFLLEKYKRADYGKIDILYENLLKIDEKMKTGKLSQHAQSPLQEELESVLLTFV